MTDPTPSLITKPVRRYANLERGTSMLEFSNAPHPLNGEYYLRGGVCWPTVQVGMPNLPYGFAVMVGQSLPSRKCWVLAESRFISVENIMDDKGSILQMGVGAFFNQSWNDYYADYYFYLQPEAIHHDHMLDVVRSRSIKPTPHFVQLPAETPEQAERKIWEKQACQRLAYARGSLIADAVIQRPVHRGVPPGPEIIALSAALCGIDVFPWRERR